MATFFLKPASQSAQHIHPVHARRIEVEHDHLGWFLLDGGQRLAPVLRGANPVAPQAQELRQPCAGHRLVIDHED